MNEIRKSFQDMKLEFNQKIEFLKKTQAEMILEMKHSISQMKASIQSLTNRIDQVENRESRMQGKVQKWYPLVKINDKPN